MSRTVAPQDPYPVPSTRRDIVCEFLAKRYGGVIPVTEGMVQSVMDGLEEGQEKP